MSEISGSTTKMTALLFSPFKQKHTELAQKSSFFQLPLEQKQRHLFRTKNILQQGSLSLIF